MIADGRGVGDDLGGTDVFYKERRGASQAA
jgi:hypothetical protein